MDKYILFVLELITNDDCIAHQEEGYDDENEPVEECKTYSCTERFTNKYWVSFIRDEFKHSITKYFIIKKSVNGKLHEIKNLDSVTDLINALKELDQ